MNEDFCSYELSKALKACGFDEPCNYGYSVKMRLGPEVSFGEPKMVHSKAPKNFNDNRKGIEKGLSFCSAVPLWHAQKWLREKKELFIEVSPNFGMRARATFGITSHEFTLFDSRGHIINDMDRSTYPSYEAALSAGIKSCVENLLK